MNFVSLRQRLISSVGYVSQDIPDRQRVAILRQDANETHLWRLDFRCGFGSFKREQERTHFDSLAIFDMDSNHSSFWLIGIQKGNENFRFDHSC